MIQTSYRAYRLRTGAESGLSRPETWGQRWVNLATNLSQRHMRAMLNFFSIIFGVVGLILAIPSLIPLLGWGNWLVLPFGVIGLALGAMSDQKSGRNLNLVVLLVAIVRLSLGGGFI